MPHTRTTAYPAAATMPTTTAASSHAHSTHTTAITATPAATTTRPPAPTSPPLDPLHPQALPLTHIAAPPDLLFAPLHAAITNRPPPVAVNERCAQAPHPPGSLAPPAGP